MKKTRRIMALVCIVVFCLALMVGCGSKEAQKEDTSGTTQGETIKLRIAGQHPVDHLATQALNRIKERIETESDGRFEVTVYPANQLGDYTLVYEEVMKGTIDIAHIFVPSTYDPKLEMSSIPYLVSNYDEMAKLFSPNSFMYKEYEKLHLAQGVKLLGIYTEGFIGQGMLKMPANPADPTAKKNTMIRVAPIEVYKLGAEDMGFTTTTIPYADLYSALQTGVADGWVGGTAALNYQSFRDVIKYYIPYNVMVENTAYLMNNELFESLSPEDQKIITDAFAEEAAASIQTCQEEDEKYMKLMADAGIEVYDLSDEELKAYADHVRSVTWPKLENQFGQEILDGLLNDLK